MTHELTATNEQLDALWASKAGTNVRTLELTSDTKLALFSDLHMGDGGKSDDMRRNTNAVVAALRHYRAEGYTIILLGDVEDLWKFDMPPVADHYLESVYKELRDFEVNGESDGRSLAAPTACRRIRVYGNHDLDWRGLTDPAATAVPTPPPGAPEAVKLRRNGRDLMLMVHGHQGSVDSDRDAWFSRFFVHIWRFLEPIAHALGWYPTNPAATECKVMGDYERAMYAWAKGAGAILVCGHSHRAYFASRSRADELRDELRAAIDGDGTSDDKTNGAGRRKELADERSKGRDVGPLDAPGQLVPCYFNTGCCLYTTGITAIEIDGAAEGRIRLVFWDAASGKRKAWHDEPLGLQSGAGLLGKVQQAHGTRASGSN